MTIPNELYPFSTQDGKAIPLEIVRPLAFVFVALSTSYGSVVLNNKFNLAALFASVDCVMDTTGLETTLVAGTTYNGMLFIPANTVVMAALPTITAKVRSIADDGQLFIQGVQQWSALNLARQFTAKTA